MALASEKLESLLRAGDVAAVQKFFQGASEPDRRAVTPQVIAWCKRLDLHWHEPYSKKAAIEIQKVGAIENWFDLVPAAYTAALACTLPKELRSLERYGIVPVDACAAVLKDRRPPWVDEYVEMLSEGELHTFGGNWKQVRALVKAGVGQPPRHENYVLQALNCIWPRYEAGKKFPPLADLLLEERDWLETDFWRLFELDGNGEVSLANCEKYNKGKQTWADALIDLSQRGVLSRERLLDSSLAALSRDFIQFRAGWFSRFYEALKPTAAEHVVRVDRYIQLLGSSIPPTVAFAVTALSLADKSQPVPAAKLVSALPPVLHARGKAVVKTALQILDTAAKREPAARSAICGVVIPALLNEAPDVQKSVFDFLDRHGDKQDEELRRKLQEVEAAVAASLKPRLSAWLGAPGRKGAAVPKIAEPAQLPSMVSRIDPSHAITPLVDLDDLIHASGAVLEEPGDPNEIERVLDGVSRLCDQIPEDFVKRTGPLRKRALKKRGPSATALERGLAMFLLSWIDGCDAFDVAPETLGHGENQYAFLFRRLKAIAGRVATRCAMPLLSAPTHAGGWIAPSALVERWLGWEKSELGMHSHEQVLAFLRMAPEGRDDARPAAKNAKGEAGDALRLALGESHKLGDNPALWLAAWRSRQPFGDLPDFRARFGDFGPDAGLGADYAWGAEGKRNQSGDTKWTSLELGVKTNPGWEDVAPRGDMLPVLFHRMWETSEEGARFLIRWAFQLWPANREAMFARGAQRLALSVDYADANDRDFCAYVEPLAEPHSELRPMACLVMAVSLAAQDAALRGHAQDALIAAIAEGRFNVGELGGTMARLLETGLGKFARWAKGLREVARVSAEHAGAVADLITRALHGDPARAPKEISALLEALFELLCEIGQKLDDPQARVYLKALPVGGKTAKLVKQILALG